MYSKSNVYTPIFSNRFKWSLRLSPLFAIGSVIAAFAWGKEDPIYYFAAIFFPIACIILPFKVVRKIRFNKFEKKIIVERFFVPPRSIAYSDIVDVGIDLIKVRNQPYVSLRNAQNIEIFKDMLADALAKRGVTPEQIEGQLVYQTIDGQWAKVIGYFIALIATLILGFLNPPWFQALGRMGFLSIWVLGLYLAYGAVRLFRRYN